MQTNDKSHTARAMMQETNSKA